MHNDRRNPYDNTPNPGRPGQRPPQPSRPRNPQPQRPPQQLRNTQPRNPGQRQPAQRANGQNPQASMQAKTPAKMQARTPAKTPARTPVMHQGGAAVRQQPAQKPGFFAYWKRALAVDPAVLEQRDLVREQGSMDYVFLILVLIMLAFGTVMVYSASYVYAREKYDDSYYIIFRQLLFIVVGFIGMAVAARFKPEFYKKFSVAYYLGCFGLLVLVPIIGEEHNGAKRWLDIGITEIQPSEFMKLGLVLMLAWYFDRYYERVTEENIFRSSFYGSGIPLMITGITCFMVLIEKHLSGTIIMFMIGVIIIFSSATPLRLLIGLGSVGVGFLAIFSVVTDYTKRRIDIWFHPENDPQGAGYQTLQGLYAIGSGGVFGVGLGESRQKHMYVSQPQNDFIFTVVCEELGMIGALAVVLLFVLFTWRGFVIAMKAPDTYSSMVVIGIVGKVAMQALLNIGVVTNSIPNTGISLPFFSYGGSSLCVLMVEMGIVLSISRFSKQKK